MMMETLLKMWNDSRCEVKPIDVLYMVAFALVVVAVGIIEGGVY